MGSTSVSCADQVCMGWLGEGSRTGNLVDSMARTTKKRSVQSDSDALTKLNVIQLPSFQYRAQTSTRTTNNLR